MKKEFVIFLLFGLVPALSIAQNAGNNDFHNWALTPPMGWNSWDCFGPSVVEDEVKANADYMAANLKEYGWEYVVVDIRWYVDNQTTGHYNAYNSSDFVIDEYGRYLPSPKRFPSSVDGKGFKPLADYVHSLGLKFGIHIMRGVPKEAVYNKLPIKGTDRTADQIYSTAYECTWLQDNYTVLKEQEGAQEYYHSILDLYAFWGVDFIKVDDLSRPYHSDEIEMLRNAIDQTGRPIVLSMSPGATPLDQHEHAKNHANMWRTIDDFWDNWSQLNYSFGKCAEWAPYISPGSWPDADMLPLGHLAIRGERGEDRYTNFTKEEQYTLMTLWAIFKSPLMFGGHMPDNDEFTNTLLTNTEVLHMHSTSLNNREWFNENNVIGWTADDPFTGDKYVAMFNNEGDGFVSTKNLLYRSGTVSTLTDGYGVDIDVSIPAGSTELYLIVNDGGDGYSCDHADWINPTIYFDSGDSISLTALSWESATAGWNYARVNQSVSGGTLNVQGTSYSSGIGTHSRSIIKYVVPDSTVRFKVFAGLDKVGTDQGCGSTVEFMIANQDPAPDANSIDSIQVPLNLSELGFNTSCTIRDVWQKQDLGTFSDTGFTTSVPAHGASLYRVSPQGRSSEIEVNLFPSATRLSPTDSMVLEVEVVPLGASANIPTGWVQIYQDDSLILNTEYKIGLEFGILSLAEGDYVFRASYSGDATYATAGSGEVSVTVKKKDEITLGQELLKVEDMVYPNPVGDMLNFRLMESHPQLEITVIDMSGSSVFSSAIKGHSPGNPIDVNGLGPGMYILHFSNGKEFSNIRFIKK